MCSTYCVSIFLCLLYAPSHQKKFQVGVNLLGNKSHSDSDSDSDLSGTSHLLDVLNLALQNECFFSCGNVSSLPQMTPVNLQPFSTVAAHLLQNHFFFSRTK